MTAYHSNTYFKKNTILLFGLLFHIITIAQTNKETYKAIKTIGGSISPKSISNNGKNLFFAQNMMYNHTVTVYDSSFHLVSTISDRVTPSQFGFKAIKGSLTGAPVESVATSDGKYLWVSNYCMNGDGYSKPGCDTCYGKKYDSSFVYKINTQTYKIENIVKVGSVPKYLSITHDQKKLIVSNWSSGDVSIVDLATEKEIRRIYAGPAPRGIACDTANTFAYVAVMGCNKIIRINLNTYQTETVASGIKNPRHLCIEKNYLYASLNGEQAICRINLLNYAMNKLVIGKSPRSMVLSTLRHKLFVDCYNDSKIAVIDLADFKLETEIKTNKYPIGICLSADNKQVWVSCYTGSIQVFALEELKETQPGIIALAPAKKKLQTDSLVTLPQKKTEAQTAYYSTLSSVAVPITELKEQSNCYIVLGSFLVKENAINLRTTLQKKGVSLELVDTKRGYTYCAYKVKIDKEDSEKEIAKLQALTGIKGWFSCLQD